MAQPVACPFLGSVFASACVLTAVLPLKAMAASPCGPTPLAPVCNLPVCTADGWDFRPLPYGTSCNSGAGICDGQGFCMLAYGKITGNVEGVPTPGGQPQIVGWACAKYVAQSIAVHVYAGGAAGVGTFVTAATANAASEPAIAQACFVSGGAYRFSVPITAAMVSQFRSAAIYVHGISPVGTPNDLLSNSGTLKFPDGEVVGTIDSISPSGADAQHISGWACARGVAGSIAVHVYAGGPAGTGTFVTAAIANVASEPAVAQACGLDGATALRFDIPISAAVNYQFRNKKIYVHGISPIAGTNSLIANSGVFIFPCPQRSPKLDPIYVGPGIWPNTFGISYCPYNFGDAVLHALPGSGFGIGSENDHWHYVWDNFAYYLNTASGIIAGGGWTDEAGCSRDGLSCAVAPGTVPQPRSSPSVCNYPSVSHEDYAMQHRDRDFDMQLVPLLPAGYIDGALLALANKAVPGGGLIPSIGIEAEWMYLYPRQGTAHYAFTGLTGPVWRTPHGSDSFIVNLDTGEPKPLPPVVLTADGWRADFPSRGDQAAVRGVLIWDCGHTESSGGFNWGYKTELHPVVAMTWLHQDDVSGSSTVHVKAMSHSPYPHLTHTRFDRLDMSFQVPAYNPSLPLCVGPVHPDYDLVRAGSWNFWLGTDLFSNQPYAYFAGSADRDFATDWSVSLTDTGAGILALSVAPRFGDDRLIAGVTDDWPLLMGAHVNVCQPARDAAGAKVNSCPDVCGACVPRTCAGIGAVCGSTDDGCGGFIWCGQCEPGSVCNAARQCEVPPAPPPEPFSCPPGTVACCGENICRTSCDFICN